MGRGGLLRYRGLLVLGHVRMSGLALDRVEGVF